MKKLADEFPPKPGIPNPWPSFRLAVEHQTWEPDALIELAGSARGAVRNGDPYRDQNTHAANRTTREAADIERVNTTVQTLFCPPRGRGDGHRVAGRWILRRKTHRQSVATDREIPALISPGPGLVP